jgi:cell division protein ZapA
MNHINVTINGRQYRMACEEGQEVQLLKLAESLESRIGTLRGKFGEIGDARLIVMAADRIEKTTQVLNRTIGGGVAIG